MENVACYCERMPRALVFPRLKGGQLVELQQVLRSRTSPAGLRQRSELIWLLAGGASLAEASEWVGLHYTNAHIWVKRFVGAGLAGLSDHPKSGRPRVYGSDVTTEVIKAAARPKDLGLKFTTWSLPKLQEYLCRQPGLGSITRSTIRRRLRQEGFRFRDGQTWCESQDPDFEVKKTKS
jgi:transposase